MSNMTTVCSHSIRDTTAGVRPIIKTRPPKMNGFVRNIKKMYERSDGHVHVLAASIRTINHLLCSFFLGTELATVPSKVLQEWAAAGFPMPDQDFMYKGVDAKGKPLKPIPYKDLDLNLPWESFDLAHELTTKGIQKFVADYQSTLRRSA